MVEIAVLEHFLLEAPSEKATETVVIEILSKISAYAMKSIGKLMGAVSDELLGKADEKLISMFVRKQLMN